MVNVGFKKPYGKGVYKGVLKSYQIPQNYTTGGVPVDLKDELDSVVVAFAQDATSGYVATVPQASISGAAFKVKLLTWSSGGSATKYGLIEEDNAKAISGMYINIFAIGT